MVIRKPVVAGADGSYHFPSICEWDGVVEASDDGPVDVGLAVPHHFPRLVLLLYVGNLCVGQVIGERDMWSQVLPIHPQDFRLEGVDDVRLYFP